MIGVILAGGIGRRLWPYSRETWPKFLLRIHHKKTLLQNTLLRFIPSIKPEHIFIVANYTHQPLIKDDLKELKLKFKTGNILGEPEVRNTAPAVALASQWILKNFGKAVMAIVPADHIIEGKRKFQEKLKQAEKVAKEGYLVTFGITPERPATGYGYIERDEKCKVKSGKSKVYKVKKFVEKPDVKRARAFLKSGKYLWNSGIFVVRADVVMEEIKRYMPGLYSRMSRWDGRDRLYLEKAYKRMKAESIDRGVVEKSEKVAVIPLQLKWKDLGDWEEVAREFPSDRTGNFLRGRVVNINSRNITVLGARRLIGTIDLELSLIHI